MKTKAHKIGGLFALLGLLLIIGTVGACEMDHIGLGQTIIQALTGLAIMKIGIELMNTRKETEE